MVVSLKKRQLTVLRQRCTIDDSQSFVLGLKIKIYSGKFSKNLNCINKNKFDLLLGRFLKGSVTSSSKHFL